MMVKKISEFWNWVLLRMEEVGIESFNELERRAGASSGAMIRRKNDPKLPTLEMSIGMCRALKVSFVELWTRAGVIPELSEDQFRPMVNQLTGLDLDIYLTLRGVDDDFKQAVLKTIKTWLVLYEELKK